MAFWQRYKDQGLMVWAIGSQDLEANMKIFARQMSLTFPILFDEDDSVHAQYNAGPSATNSVYPQHWIIGADGALIYTSNTYSPDTMRALIEAELDQLKTR